MTVPGIVGKDETEADYWRDVRPAMQSESKQRRAANRQNSRDLLVAAGIEFMPRNNGAHLIVHASGHVYDFFPGTGLWRMRGSTQQHRGVRRLIKQIKG